MATQIAPWDTVLIPAGEGWRPATEDEIMERACRWSNVTRCPNKVTWMMNRGFYNSHLHKTVDAWWGYCDVHLYGRLVLDGELFIAGLLVNSGWRDYLC